MFCQLLCIYYISFWLSVDVFACYVFVYVFVVCHVAVCSSIYTSVPDHPWFCLPRGSVNALFCWYYSLVCCLSVCLSFRTFVHSFVCLAVFVSLCLSVSCCLFSHRHAATIICLFVLLFTRLCICYFVVYSLFVCLSLICSAFQRCLFLTIALFACSSLFVTFLMR